MASILQAPPPPPIEGKLEKSGRGKQGSGAASVKLPMFDVLNTPVKVRDCMLQWLRKMLCIVRCAARQLPLTLASDAPFPPSVSLSLRKHATSCAAGEICK